MRVPKPKPSTVTRIASHVTVDTSERGLRQTRQQSRGPCSLTGPIPVTVDPLQRYCNCTKKTTVTKIVAPRHNRQQARGQKISDDQPKKHEDDCHNDDHDYRHHHHHHQYHHEHGFTKHPKQIQTCRGEPPTHTTPQGGKGGNHQSPHPNHTTPQGGGKQPTTTPHHTTGGEGSNPAGGGGTIGGGEGGGRPNARNSRALPVVLVCSVYLYSCIVSAQP